ncbi:peptidase inhibitor family I36 protein [Saccharopolyspora sp. NPDC050642]|uniref:peptidase inhibitor family I36 protein n=1 Tax=Saccharopolyspora sp. NPDC050642 TaxID=3157099 RepID=UPI0033CDBACD
MTCRRAETHRAFRVPPAPRRHAPRTSTRDDAPPPNCPPNSMCLYQGENYSGTPEYLPIDWAGDGMNCQVAESVFRSVYNRSVQTQIVFQTGDCRGNRVEIKGGTGVRDFSYGGQSYIHS